MMLSRPAYPSRVPFSGMFVRRLALASLIGATSLMGGCSGLVAPSACTDFTEIMVGVSGLDGVDCDVTIVNGPHVAVFRFPATSDAGTFDAVPDGFCAQVTYAPSSRPDCVTQAGPSPDVCARNSGCLLLEFSGPRLRSFLSDHTYELSATCGTVTIVHAQPGTINCPVPG
jgi:hypothetical protein